MDNLRTKEVLNRALSSIPKGGGGGDASSVNSVSKLPVCKYLTCKRVKSILVGNGKILTCTCLTVILILMTLTSNFFSSSTYGILQTVLFFTL